MAGLGGCLGYALGAINWDATAVGKLKEAVGRIYVKGIKEKEGKPHSG
jgi:hypothetical protein